MSSSYLFGDVIRYNNREYIFLARTENITYAAEILNYDDSVKLDNFVTGQICRGRDTINSPLYCYVKLSTEIYKDRCAKLLNSDKENDSIDEFEKVDVQINSKDLMQIYKEISESKFIAKGLQLLVKDMNLSGK